MNAVKVDDKNRVQLAIFNPGDLYAPEFEGPELVILRRIDASQDLPTEVLDVSDVDPITLLPKGRRLKITPESIVAAVRAERQRK